MNYLRLFALPAMLLWVASCNNSFTRTLFNEEEEQQPGGGTPTTDRPVDVSHYPGPRQVIVFIGDGMQLAHEVSASRYVAGTDQGLSFHRFPYQGHATTWDVTSYNHTAKKLGRSSYSPGAFDPFVGYDATRGGGAPYPLANPDTADAYFTETRAADSASTMTAIMTGVKTDTGNVAWLPGDPENGPIETIAEKLRSQLNYSIGIGTTVPFSHATPAGVMAHNISRGNQSPDKKALLFSGTTIAEEMVHSARPEVVISAGHPLWLSGYISGDLFDELKSSADYLVVERATGVPGAETLRAGALQAATGSRKLWGLFGNTTGNLSPLVPSDTPGAPSFSTALEDPTLAQVVEATLSRLAIDPDGFLAVFEQGDIDWASHSNHFSWMIGGVVDLSNAVTAAVAFIDKPGDRIDWNNTLVIVTADHATGYLRLNPDKRLGAGDLPTQVPSGGRYAYPDGEITWGSAGHTNELVMVYARGGGIDLLKPYEGRGHPGTRIIDQSDIFKVIRAFTGAD
jgi:alkaline phosphatase